MTLNVSVEQRKNLLEKHPYFAKFTPDEIAKLAHTFSEQGVVAGELIVGEGVLVDSIYFIVAGRAEVRQTIMSVDHAELVPIAILNPGESIGLTETGFYSHSGVRTATVVALSDMVLLRLALPTFYEFLKSYAHDDAIMRENAEVLLRMNFIKKAAPFAKLTMEKISWLANQVRQFSVNQGQIIFKQGEEGESCYLIQSGKIEIFLVNPDGIEQRLAILKSPQIFGEAAILMDLPRNACARALKDSQLLELKRETIWDVTDAVTDTQAALMRILKARSRPIRLSHIECHVQNMADGTTLITLKDSQHGNYYRLSEQGWFIWQLLNGYHTLRDISLAFYNEYDVFDPGMISAFILDLAQAGFIEKGVDQEPAKVQQSGKLLTAIVNIRKIMEASVSFGHVDDWLATTYQYGVRFIYTYVGQLVMITIGLIGVVVFAKSFNHYVGLLHRLPHVGWLIIAGISGSMATVVIHELAHAYTTKACGYKVRNFGIGWFWIGPIAFCDTSDMWLGSRRQRLAVDLAGIYIDIILGGLAAILALVVHNEFLKLFFWLIALFNYISIFTSLSPIIELDGYYALMDVLGVDNLRETSITWLVDEFPSAWRHPHLFLKHKVEVIYWSLCLLYIVLQMLIAFVVLNILLEGVLGIQNPYLALLSPLAVVTFSSLGIWGEIHQKRAG